MVSDCGVWTLPKAKEKKFHLGGTEMTRPFITNGTTKEETNTGLFLVTIQRSARQ